MNSNMHLETILWLNKQIDNIHAQSVLIGELMMGEDNVRIIKKYDKKLSELEKELESVHNKIETERRMLANSL